MRTHLNKKTSLTEWIENLQKKGRITFTKEEAIKSLGLLQTSFRQALSRLSKKKKVVRLSNGLYASIPLNYQSGRGLPSTLYINQYMQFHKQDYYIGLLSAASYYGSTHQAAQELQVITSKQLRPAIIQNSKIRFFTKKNLTTTPIQKVNVQTGQINVSSAEATALDLVRFMNKSGGLNHIATVLLEMKHVLNPKRLIVLSKNEPDLSVVQRLGFLLNLVGEKECSQLISHFILKNNSRNYIKLDPNSSYRNSKKNASFMILENTEVEPDDI